MTPLRLPSLMPRVIATISLKGGVGKTTVTAGVAEFLSAVFGKRVLLVDLDAQTSLTTVMIGPERWLELNDRGRTLATLFSDASTGPRISIVRPCYSVGCRRWRRSPVWTCYRHRWT